MTKALLALIPPALLLVLLALVPGSGAAAPGSTERVSVSSAEVESDLGNEEGYISEDGRYVVFSSEGTNLVADDTNQRWDGFLRDQEAGTTTRVTVNSAGEEADQSSFPTDISPDGRYIVFVSQATNLVPNHETNVNADIYVRDRLAGTTEIVSTDSAGNYADANNMDGAISADGRYVAFISSATNLVADDLNGMQDAYVHDRMTGATERVSVDSNETERPDNTFDIALSADGRYVAFTSRGTFVSPDTVDGPSDIFVRDRQTGNTERVSVDSNGVVGNDSSFEPSISNDGRFISFISRADNLAPGDTNAQEDIYVHDRQSGDTELVSVDNNGDPGNDLEALNQSISPDGRYISFSTMAPLVPDDTNGTHDAFVRDLLMDTTERVSVDSAGAEVSGNSYGSNGSVFSADGTLVTFISDSEDLVPADTNGLRDVFVHDRTEPATPTPTPSPSPSPSPSESPTPSGTQVATDTASPTPSSTPTQTATATPTPTSTAGETDTPTVTPTSGPTLIQGNVDCRPPADSIDALQLLLFVAHLPTNQADSCPEIDTLLAAFALVWGDVNCDGEVNSVDALFILLFVAHLPYTLPAGCPDIGEALT